MVRPALLWNDTRSAGAARDLVADLGGPQAWADRVGLVPVASFTRQQAAVAGRPRAGPGSSYGGGVPAARLADLAAVRSESTSARSSRTAATPAARATGRRPRRATTSSCSSSALGHRARRCPRVAGPAETVGPPRVGGAGRRVRRQRRRRARAGRRTGRRRGVAGHLRGRLGGLRRRGPRRLRRGGRLRRRDRAVPAPGRHAQRHPGPRRDLPDARASTSTGCPRWRSRRPRAPTGWCWCPTCRASGRRTGPTPPARCTASPWPTPRPPTWRAPPSRDCSAALPTASTPWWPRAAASTGCCWWEAGPRPRRYAASPRSCWGVRSRCRRPRSTSPAGPPGRPPGPGPGPRSRRTGSRVGCRTRRTSTGVRERYAEARDLTVARA